MSQFLNLLIKPGLWDTLVYRGTTILMHNLQKYLSLTDYAANGREGSFGGPTSSEFQTNPNTSLGIVAVPNGKSGSYLFSFWCSCGSKDKRFHKGQ